MPTPKALQDVQGENAIRWVEEQNKKTEEQLYTHPKFPAFLLSALTASASDHQIYKIQHQDDNLYRAVITNHSHPRGKIAQISQKDFVTHELGWETILDIDQLALHEKKDWVYRELIEEEFDDTTYCLVSLSEGGRDAHVLREYNLKKKRFVADGFYIPSGLTEAIWLSKDALLITKSANNEHEPQSAYILKRGKSLDQAAHLFSVDTSHIKLNIIKYESSESGSYLFFKDVIDFYNSHYYLMQPGETESFFNPLPIPSDAELLDVFQDMAIIKLSSDWKINSKYHFKANSIISLNLAKFRKNPNALVTDLSLKLCFQAHERSAILSLTSNENHLFVEILHELNTVLVILSYSNSKFRKEFMPFDRQGHIEVISADSESKDVIIHFQNYLTPCEQYSYNHKKKCMTLLRRGSTSFDASKFEVKLYHAVSSDGTQIPYFLVCARDLILNGSNPTLLYGYGGFGDCVKQEYLGIHGANLLEKGFVYVEACIRGGGEFGPQWTTAGIRESKQNSIDDFLAVARDLIAKNITTPRFLGIQGSSNGGLLVGAAYTQAPELFNAVICEVPVLDMLNYHRFFSGPWWLAEYGDPRDPQMKPILASYSPLHNIKAGVTYPPILLQTSSADDRVHPYHARMMARRLIDMEQRVYFCEDINGGHSFGVDINQIAFSHARNHLFLYQQLLEPHLSLTRTMRHPGFFARQAGTKRNRDELEERTIPHM